MRAGGEDEVGRKEERKHDAGWVDINSLNIEAPAVAGLAWRLLSVFLSQEQKSARQITIVRKVLEAW